MRRFDSDSGFHALVVQLEGQRPSKPQGAGSNPAESAWPRSSTGGAPDYGSGCMQVRILSGSPCCPRSSSGRASLSEGEGCGFESRRGLCGEAVGCRLGPITPATPVQFRLPPPRAVPRLRDHSLIRSRERVRFPSARPSRCGPVWQDVCFGSRKSEVQILSPRPWAIVEMESCLVHTQTLGVQVPHRLPMPGW
jgi:hypothetical protein